MEIKTKAVYRELPDGSPVPLWPFHVSFEGLETIVICRDDEDCDTMVKCLFVCAWKHGVRVIIYAVVSNHAHFALLAKNYDCALACAQDVKKRYSQLFRGKYKESKVLKGADVNVQAIDTMRYLRNALAYIPRNAYDNGATSLSDYKWTGFSAFFRDRRSIESGRRVSSMTTRDWRDLFHTGENLSAVPWQVNGAGELIPHSCCDVEYLEAAFNNDQTFFLNRIGGLNVAEMTQKLVVAPRKMKTDADFLKETDAVAVSWFGKETSALSVSQKSRLLSYMYHVTRTSVPQLARIFGLGRDHITLLLRKRR